MLTKIYRSTVFVLIVLTLGVIAYFMHSLIELIIMLTVFLISKQFYLYKYHCKSALHCLFMSVGVFVVMLRLTLPVGVSYVSAGISGLLVAYAGQWFGKMKYIQEDYEYIEPRYNQLVEEKRKINLYTMDEEALREYCKGFLFDEIDTEIVIQRLVYHLRGQELYDKIGYSKVQMIRREKRIESKLNIKLKDR